MEPIKSKIQSKNWELLREKFNKSAKEDPILRNIPDSQRERLIDSVMEQSIAKIKSEILETWECPLLNNKKWDCNFDKKKKGQEPFCRNIEHFKCPSFNRNFTYVLHSRITKARKKS